MSGLGLGELREMARLSLEELLEMAGRLRRDLSGDGVELCSIVNAKSGLCSEDCAYCAQSVHHRTGAPVYEALDPEVVLAKAKAVEEAGVANFSVVTSGNELDDESFGRALNLIELIRSHTHLRVCASLGKLDERRARLLRSSGIHRYHHNLETSPGFFPRICTTHTFQDRLETVRLAQREGLSVCSGVLIGLGETLEDRLELALILRDLGIDSVPFNVLIPIPGTPLGERPVPPAEEVLKALALLRIALPKATIRLCAGRERSLGERQIEALKLCADGMMVGGYLTQPGRELEEDLKTVASAGLKPATFAR